MPATKAKQTLVATTTPHGKAPKHHFFASSAAAWHVSYDLQWLIRRFKRDAWTFNVYLVPGPVDTPYRIENYAPQVQGTQWLCAYVLPSQVERSAAALAAAAQPKPDEAAQ